MSEEYFLKYGENVCVHAIVERPSLYINGRCPSNDQRILYSDIRLGDISLLRENLETSDGIPIRDKMRIFNIHYSHKASVYKNVSIK